MSADSVVQTEVTDRNFRISKEKFERFRGCMEDAADTMDWQDCWVIISDLLCQCTNKAFEENRHEAVAQCHRLDRLFTEVLAARPLNALEAPGRNVKGLLIQCPIPLQYTSWREYFALVGNYHRTEIDRALRVLQDFEQYLGADNYQTLPESTWVWTARNELQGMRGLM